MIFVKGNNKLVVTDQAHIDCLRAKGWECLDESTPNNSSNSSNANNLSNAATVATVATVTTDTADTQSTAGEPEDRQAKDKQTVTKRKYTRKN